MPTPLEILLDPVSLGVLALYGALMLWEAITPGRRLAKVKGWSGGVARSVATTQLIDALARKLDRPVHQTPVGIKWLAEWVLKGDVVGGGESAGVCFRGHVPDKDGILVNLLILHGSDV